MKKLIYLLLLFLGVVSCGEDAVEPKIDSLPNYYVIANDNPNDPVQVKRYELYKTYGVPVYFNDTVARVFVGISYRGDSVYRYERVDMNWSFSSNSAYQFRYEHQYLQTQEEKLNALRVAELFLQNASKPLRPFCMLLTNYTNKIEISTSRNSLENSYEIGYRALLFHNLSAYTTDETKKIFIDRVKKQMVSNKLENYKKEMEAFENVSDKNWYGKSWKETVAKGGLGVVWDSSHVMNYYGSKPTIQYPHKIELTAMRLAYAYYERDYHDETPESIESLRQNVRVKIGAFGFVGVGRNSIESYKETEEFQIFLTEMLTTDRTEFVRRWGESPLVMEKYEILYKVIRDELEIEL